MQCLRIWDGDIGDQGARFLSLFVTDTRNSSLSILELLNCNIGPLGCVMISRMFEPSLPTKISYLTLDYNTFGNEGLNELMLYLKNNKSVKSLSLAYCDIDERGIAHLETYMSTTTTLVSLNLQGNPLKNAGVKELIPMLLKCKCIEEINLNNVFFGNGPERAVNEDLALKDKGSQVFDPDGVIGDLSNLMINNQNLVVYHLKFNFITDKDFELLLKTLKESCPHICQLSVDEKIKRELFDQLLAALKGKKRGGKKGKNPSKKNK